MKVYRDFRCYDGHVTERYLENEVITIQCEQCPALAHKTLSAPRFTLEGWSGSFPGAAMKWEERHEKGHRDFVKEHGPDWESV